MKTTLHPSYPLTLYYDAACPICDAEMHNLMLRNQAGLLCFIDVSAADFNAPPPGCSKQDLLTLIHGQSADGHVIKGVEVFRLAYAAVGLPWVSRLLALPLLRPLSEAVYPWLARHRQQIPRWISRGLFGHAMRQAAQRAAARAPCGDSQSCRIDSKGGSA